MGAALKRDDLGRILPGQPSFNPGGRPKGFKGVAAAIMKESRNCDEFIEFAFKVLRNEGKNFKHSDQTDMLKLLWDRAIGKPTSTVIELPPEDLPETIAFDDITPEALDDVTKAIEKALKSV